MKHAHRMQLGGVLLGAFLVNAAYYVLSGSPHPVSGVASMTLWILMWIFVADSGHGQVLDNGDKFFGAFTMGVATCYLLYHIVAGSPFPSEGIKTIPPLLLAVLFFWGAVVVGMWWAEVCPVD